MFPQLLLLGNGINRSCDADSWDTFLKSISKREDLNVDNLTCPMYMKPILLSGDCIDKELKEQANSCYGKVNDASLYRKFLDLDFDDIITTNYSYELEISSKDNLSISDYYLTKIQNHTDAVRRCESKYLLHTFNEIKWNSKSQRVWHIHGEARKPGSMILGQYYYGNLFSKIKYYLDRKSNEYKEKQDGGIEIITQSWLDSFILGDVYIVGLGLDYSEFDLWWLINRKKREKANHGKIYFFEPYNENNIEKYELLKIMEVEVKDLGCINKDVDYKKFYCDAVNYISEIRRLKL